MRITASFIKTLCLLLTTVIFAALLPGSIYADSTYPTSQKQDMTDQLKIIDKFCSYINEGDWLSWANLYTPVAREDRLLLVSNELNHTQNIGILTVNHIDLLEATQVSNSAAPWTYAELRPFFDNDADYACYRLLVETKVNVDNDYYRNGMEYQLMVLVRDENGWGIGVVCECPEELIPGNETIHLNPYYEIKAKNYDEVTAIFPDTYPGSVNNSNYIKGPNNFTLSFYLPKGWSYREIKSNNGLYLGDWAYDTSSDRNLIYIYNDYNACVGAIGYADLSELPIDNSNFDFNHLSDIDIDNGFRFTVGTDCISISNQLEKPANNITIITKIQYSSQFLNNHGIQALERSSPAILSYEDHLGILVAFELDPNYVTGIQLLDIAESIRIIHSD